MPKPKITFQQDPYIILAVIVTVLLIFIFAFMPRNAVRDCHMTSQNSAKQRLMLRANAEPDNAEYKQAIRSGLFIEQDYLTFYRNCMRGKGYQS